MPNTRKVLDKAIKAMDNDGFYQLRFGSGKIEGIKGDIDYVKETAKLLKKKYGEKSVFISQRGKPIASYID